MPTLAKRGALFFAGGIALFIVALLLVRPYSRMERVAADALQRYAPRGTTVSAISVTFPLNIVLTNLTVPVQMQGEQRQLELEELSGRISVLSLFSGDLELGMNGDFFGGTLWLDVSAKAPPAAGAAAAEVAFDVRARDVDVAELSEFFRTGVLVSGICDADLEGELIDDNLANLNGEALAMGREIFVPNIEIEGMILPQNSDVEFTTRLSAKDGTVDIKKLEIHGLAYDLSGKGTIQLSDPPEKSSLDCSFHIIFKEQPVVTDESLSDMGAEYVLEALVDTGAEVHFNLSGTLDEPELKLDLSSSFGSILRNSSR